MASIELHPAYVYDCDECGREVFVRAVVPEGLSEEDKKHILEELGEEGPLTIIPTEVICPTCGAAYDTEARWIDG